MHLSRKSIKASDAPGHRPAGVTADADADVDADADAVVDVDATGVGCWLGWTKLMHLESLER